jgi:hypothetical protein
MNRRRFQIAGLAILLAAVGLWCWRETPSAAAPNPMVNKLMREKLVHAQSILEGLAVEDFEKIAKGSKALNTLSEEADWLVLPGVEYVRHSSDFQRITNELTVAANNKQLDAATLLYVRLTMNCVDCHKYVRQARRAPAK